MVRKVHLAGTTNVRDLGPLPIHDGRWVRRGKVFRGEALTGLGPGPRHLDGDEAQPFKGLGLRTILDLRSDNEYAARPSAWSAVSGATVRRFPVAEGGEGSDTYLMGLIAAGRITQFSAEDLGQFYIGALRRQSATFGSVLRTLSREQALPSLIHCANGKDRTGIVVAVLLSFLGVPRDHIVADYLFSGTSQPDLIDRFVDQIRSAGAEPDAVRPMFETPAVAMHMLLDHLESQPGGTVRYLVGHAGLQPQELDRLQSLLTTDSP
nr:tyrosine-protein phosphatase [Intrasporangium chromatireducens]